MATNPNIILQGPTDTGIRLSNLLSPESIENRRATLDQIAANQASRQAWKQSGGDLNKYAEQMAPVNPEFAQQNEQRQAVLRQKQADFIRQMYGKIAMSPDDNTIAGVRNEALMAGINPEHVKTDFDELQGMTPEQRQQVAQSRAQSFDSWLKQQNALQLADAKSKGKGGGSNRGQVIFDNQGNAFLANLDTSGKPTVQPYINPTTKKQFTAAQFDPNLKSQLSGASRSGAIAGESQTKEMIDLPQTLAEGEQTIELIDDLISHPGIDVATGLSSYIDPRNITPGTEAYDFKIRMDQLLGKQFMQAYQTLKGGGQITEIEGKKATDAMSRMRSSTSKDQFINSAREFQDVIRKGMERAKTKAGVKSVPQVKFLGFE